MVQRAEGRKAHGVRRGGVRREAEPGAAGAGRGLRASANVSHPRLHRQAPRPALAPSGAPLLQLRALHQLLLGVAWGGIGGGVRGARRFRQAGRQARAGGHKCADRRKTDAPPTLPNVAASHRPTHLGQLLHLCLLLCQLACSFCCSSRAAAGACRDGGGWAMGWEGEWEGG